MATVDQDKGFINPIFCIPYADFEVDEDRHRAQGWHCSAQWWHSSVQGDTAVHKDNTAVYKDDTAVRKDDTTVHKVTLLL